MSSAWSVWWLDVAGDNKQRRFNLQHEQSWGFNILNQEISMILSPNPSILLGALERSTPAPINKGREAPNHQYMSRRLDGDPWKSGRQTQSDLSVQAVLCLEDGTQQKCKRWDMLVGDWQESRKNWRYMWIVIETLLRFSQRSGSCMVSILHAQLHIQARPCHDSAWNRPPPSNWPAHTRKAGVQIRPYQPDSTT
jgi:hypothetical protein